MGKVSQRRIHLRFQEQHGQSMKHSRTKTSSHLWKHTLVVSTYGDAILGGCADSITEGVSADYDIPEGPAWMPFQRVKNYEIPEQILDQSNHSQFATSLGLFTELNHAYIIIDNSLYLWDYTHPSPEIVGYEENNSLINTVKLVKPRPGVFVATITHLLVVATNTEIILIGVAAQATLTGSKTVSLYSTRMSVPLKGISCKVIEASSKTGRIFFGGGNSDDVWELTYQQEERWFKSRCDKINHTATSYVLPGALNIFGTRSETETVVQMVVDDTRDLLYTLSSKSTIRVFNCRMLGTLSLSLTRPFSSIVTALTHTVPRTELLGPGAKIISISPISSTESTQLSLQALTSTGCRIFFSLTSTSSVFSASASTTLNSMAPFHVRFPPRDPSAQAPPSSQSGQVMQFHAGSLPPTEVNSRLLTPTAAGTRYAPGYSLLVVKSAQDPSQDRLFCSTPDSGRLKLPREANEGTRYLESAQWFSLGSLNGGLGLVTPPFAASKAPSGFGNEIAVQFDSTTAEIAIMTNNGISTIRRRRLVDVFAAILRTGGDKEGREGEVRKFIRFYGRVELAATALAVACGQGSDVTSDSRIAFITEPEVIEAAREAFIQHGGRASISDTTILDNPSLDSIRLSPRHEGMALYVSRVVRSVWAMPIMFEQLIPGGGSRVNPSVPVSKLQEVQRALNSLQEFLNKNRSSIEGLSGPEALGRVSTKQEEIALQAEHRAMNALVQLVSSVIEGIAFVLMLFDERVDEILLALPEAQRQRVRQLTYEGLFCSDQGRELAKELVKAIVNRNIANGSNVDTVAEALRRRCGSFCSADDVIVFKAQEQVKRASETGANSEAGRAMLNESLRLFRKVAGFLSMEHLQWAVEQYIGLAFYAGKNPIFAHYIVLS